MNQHLISQVSLVNVITSYPYIVTKDPQQPHETASHTFPSSDHSSETFVFLGISAD